MGSPVSATGPGPRRWVAPFCLLVAVLLFFHPLLAGEGVLFFRDISLNHYPTRLYVSPILRSGHLPLWNPYLSGGMPLAANPNNLIFHPISLLFLILPVPVAFHASILLQYLLAGWGMLCWGRESGLREEAALLGGLTYALSGGMASCGTLQNLLSSWAWVPVALYAFVRHRNTGSRTAWLGFATALAVQLLAGDPVAAGTTLVFCLVEALWGVSAETRTRRRGLIALGLGAMAGFGLALLQILPAREMLAESGRAAGVPFPDASVWSIPPVRLLEAVVPSLYGDATALKPSTYWGGLVFEKGYPFLLSIYLGAIPLLLSLVALGRRRDRRVLALWGATVLAVTAALGPGAFVYPLLYRYVPLVASLRYPSRFMLPAFFFLSSLAALGFDHLREEMSREREDRYLGLLLGGSALLSAGGGILGLSPSLIDRFVHYQLGIPTSVGEEAFAAINRSLQGRFLRCALLAAGMSVGVMAVRRLRMNPSLASVLILLAVGADLVSANFHVNPVGPSSIYDSRSPILELIGDEDPPYRVYRDSRPRNLAVLALSDSAWWGYSWDQLSLRVNTSLPHQVWMAYDPSTDLLSPRSVNSLAAEMQDLDVGRVRRLSEVASVGVLVTYRELDDPYLIPSGRIARQTNVPLRLYRNRNPLPRAYLVSGARPEHGTALMALTDSGFDPRAEVYLERISKPQGIAGEAGQARLLESLPEKIVLGVSARRPGWLVLTDNYYPGWTAEMDNKRVQIRRANYLFRAVEVPAGEHRLVFRYRPRSLVLGGIGSLVTLAVCGTWVFRPRKDAS